MGLLLKGSPENLVKSVLLLIACLCAVALALSQWHPAASNLAGSFLLRVRGAAPVVCPNQTVYVRVSNGSASVAEAPARVSIVDGELDECAVPCDVLQLGNLTSLSEVDKINCNVRYFNMTQMLTTLAAHKGQAWVQYSGDSLIRNQFVTIAEEILGLEVETIPHARGICCSLDGLARNSSDRCIMWTSHDFDIQDRSTLTWERARKALREKTADFCITYEHHIFITDAFGLLPLLFRPGEIQPLVVVYDMGLHSISHGSSRLAFRHSAETLTEKLRAVRLQQREEGYQKWANETRGKIVSTDRPMFTRFIYHMPTALTEEVFTFVDPLRRNERVELFVKILEQHTERNADLYDVVDTSRLTRFIDRRHNWMQLKVMDGIHPYWPFYHLVTLLDFNYISGLFSLCANKDDLEYLEGKEMNAKKDEMWKIHGWGG